MKDVERRFIEIRSPEPDSRILEGIVITYGEKANGDYGPERFEAGSLEYGDCILNVQHDRGRPIARTPDTLQLIDSKESLRLRADLPETREGTDALTMVRNRILQGLSVEFRAIQERLEAGVRVITRARLTGIGLVDSPSYEGSRVEARSIKGATLSFSVDYGLVLQCECCPTSDEVWIEPGAFGEYVKDESKELLAVHGNFTGAIASRKRGSLKVNDTDERLEVSTEIADTTAGRDILEQGKDVEILGRPIIDYEKSDTEVVDGTTRVKKAFLRGFLLGPSDSNKGWDPVKFTVDGEERSILTCDKRGIPFWL